MSKKPFTANERIAFYNSIEYLDPDKTYINYNKEKDTLSYTRKINTLENIIGTPTDEELTRALIVLRLITDYGYSCDKLVLEDAIERVGSKSSYSKKKILETDICIKNDDGEYELIFEIKKIQDYNEEKDYSIECQLFNPFNEFSKYKKVKYLYYVTSDIPLSKEHNSIKSIGIDTTKTRTFSDWSNEGKIPHFTEIIKSNEEIKPSKIFIKQNNSEDKTKDLNYQFGISEIKRLWKSLWDYIWGGSLEDNKKFENFNKILLAKLYDESKTPEGMPYTFQKMSSDSSVISNKDLSRNIDLLYRKAYIEYLSKDKEIELFSVKGIDFNEFSTELVAKCVEILQSYSFRKNIYKNVDVLGEFYEMVIRDSFKQTKGLFLTHPNIVLFILSALGIKQRVKETLKKPSDRRYRLPFIIDPSCGTGTFLIHYMQYLQKYIEDNHIEIENGDTDIAEFIERSVLDKYAYKWVIDYVYGIDIEPVLATACQINLILHGDGSTNIYNADGLSKFEDYRNHNVVGATNTLSSDTVKETSFYSKEALNKFDFIISNPPFNVKINKGSDLFEITGKSEAFFLERWYQLLKPKGRIGVVLPESFFSVDEDVQGRVFLYKHFNVKAIVSLPSHAFLPHTPTNTSLLFAEKKSVEEEMEFIELYNKYYNKFDDYLGQIMSVFPKNKKDVYFSKVKKDKGNHIKNIIQDIECNSNRFFGDGFIIFPFFKEEELLEEKYNILKKSLKEIILASKERWVLNSIFTENELTFFNFIIDDIGYKAGKKGSKDRPNELIAVYDENGNRIYNVKYAYKWKSIDEQDKNTVLGRLQELNIWQ